MSTFFRPRQHDRAGNYGEFGTLPQCRVDSLAQSQGTRLDRRHRKAQESQTALPPGAKQLGFARVVLVRKDRFAFCRPIRRHHKGAEQHEQKCGRLIPCEDIHADENRRDRCHNRLQVHINPRGNPRLSRGRNRGSKNDNMCPCWN